MAGEGKTIRQVLRLRAGHGIPQVVIDKIGGYGAQAFVNMNPIPDARLDYLEAELCPEDGEELYPPGNLLELHTQLMKVLGEAGYTPQAVVASAPTPVAPAADQVMLTADNIYRRLILREISLDEALADPRNKLQLYIPHDELERLVALVEVYCLIGTGFFADLAKDPDRSADNMRLIGTPQRIMDGFNKWLKRSSIRAATQESKYYLLEDLLKTFAKVNSLFGNGWGDIIRMVGMFRDTVDTNAMLGGIGTIDLSRFGGLGRLGNDLPLLVEGFYRSARQGAFLSEALQPIEQLNDLMELLNQPELTTVELGGGKKTSIERSLNFLGKVARVSPNPFRLARIAGGLVLIMGLVPQELGTSLDKEIVNAMGVASLLYGSLFDQVARELGKPAAVTYDLPELWNLRDEPVLPKSEAAKPQVKVYIGTGKRYATTQGDPGGIKHLNEMAELLRRKTQIFQQALIRKPDDFGTIMQLEEDLQHLADIVARLDEIRFEEPGRKGMDGEFRDLMVQFLTESEVETICLDMGWDPRKFPKEFDARCREITLQARRHVRRGELMSRVRAVRPEAFEQLDNPPMPAPVAPPAATGPTTNIYIAGSVGSYTEANFGPGSQGGTFIGSQHNYGAPAAPTVELPQFYGNDDEFLNIVNLIRGMTPAQWAAYMPLVQGTVAQAGLRFRADLAHDRLLFARHYYLTELRPDLLITPLGWVAPEWQPYMGELFSNQALDAHMSAYSTVGMFRAFAAGIGKPPTIFSNLNGHNGFKATLMDGIHGSYDHVTSAWFKIILRSRNRQHMLQVVNQYATTPIGPWWLG